MRQRPQELVLDAVRLLRSSVEARVIDRQSCPPCELLGKRQIHRAVTAPRRRASDADRSEDLTVDRKRDTDEAVEPRGLDDVGTCVVRQRETYLIGDYGKPLRFTG